MELGKWLKEYRRAHKMTMQDMANACGFSKSYVSMLEKGINPTTNKPVSPTMQIFEKIATATGQEVDSLLKILDGEQPITINPSSLHVTINAEESQLLNGYRTLDSSQKQTLFNMLAFLKSSQGTNAGSVVLNNKNGNNVFSNSGNVIMT